MAPRLLLVLAIGLAVGAVVGYLVAASPTQLESRHVPAWLEVTQRICTSVGGLGTFVALIFLMRQFVMLQEQNKLMQTNIQASLDGQLYTRLDSFNKFIAEHDVEYDMLAKPFAEIEPSAHRARLHRLCDLGFSIYEQIYKYHARFHLLKPEEWEEWQQNMAHFFAKPYVRGYWPTTCQRYARNFRVFADQLIVGSQPRAG